MDRGEIERGREEKGKVEEGKEWRVRIIKGTNCSTVNEFYWCSRTQRVSKGKARTTTIPTTNQPDTLYEL